MTGHIIHELGCSEPCTCGALDRWLGVETMIYPEDDETMVDLGGGMVVPLRELLEDEES